MNLVGKIITVAILVLSILFMAFSIAIFVTHKNWREVVINETDAPDKPLGLSKQLRQTLDRNKDLTDQSEKLKQQYDVEKAAKIQAVAKLEGELKLVKDELNVLDTKLAELNKKKQIAETDLDTTQQSTTKLRKEFDSDRQATAQTIKDRDAQFKEVVLLTDKLNQTVDEREALQKRMDELTKDLAKADKVLRKLAN